MQAKVQVHHWIEAKIISKKLRVLGVAFSLVASGCGETYDDRRSEGPVRSGLELAFDAEGEVPAPSCSRCDELKAAVARALNPISEWDAEPEAVVETATVEAMEDAGLALAGTDPTKMSIKDMLASLTDVTGIRDGGRRAAAATGVTEAYEAYIKLLDQFEAAPNCPPKALIEALLAAQKDFLDKLIAFAALSNWKITYTYYPAASPPTTVVKIDVLEKPQSLDALKAQIDAMENSDKAKYYREIIKRLVASIEALKSKLPCDT